MTAEGKRIDRTGQRSQESRAEKENMERRSVAKELQRDRLKGKIWRRQSTAKLEQ